MSAHSVHAFAEKVSFVSDGENAVGRAVALQLALLGSYVIVGTKPGGTPLIEELKSLGTLATSISHDFTTQVGATNAAADIGTAFGRLDYLVNCLKILPESSFENSGEEECDTIVGTNFKAAYLLTNACLPLMSGRPKPKIVNLVSRGPSINAPLFDATQAAIEGLTRSLARSLPTHFRVNAVASTASGHIRDGFDPGLFPMSGTGSADDTARAVLYLLSPEAVGVNGQVLEVTG